MKQNYLKSALLSVMLCIASIMSYAQTVNDVTLTVSSDGATKEEATKNALRSAIEQAYGTFVSANTTILNDELVKDEIVTIANGNIKSYDEISSTAMPDGSQFVTLKATVSVSKLISYAQSKGAETEFAGATFGMNMKMHELNQENEKKVLDNLLIQVNALIPDSFDYKLVMEDPKVSSGSPDDFMMDMKIYFVPNYNTGALIDLIMNTLNSLALDENEYAEMRRLNIEAYGAGLYVSKQMYVPYFVNKFTDILTTNYAKNIEPIVNELEQIGTRILTETPSRQMFDDAVRQIVSLTSSMPKKLQITSCASYSGKRMQNYLSELISQEINSIKGIYSPSSYTQSLETIGNRLMELPAEIGYSDFYENCYYTFDNLYSNLKYLYPQFTFRDPALARGPARYCYLRSDHWNYIASEIHESFIESFLNFIVTDNTGGESYLKSVDGNHNVGYGLFDGAGVCIWPTAASSDDMLMIPCIHGSWDSECPPFLDNAFSPIPGIRIQFMIPKTDISKYSNFQIKKGSGISEAAAESIYSNVVLDSSIWDDNIIIPGRY